MSTKNFKTIYFPREKTYSGKSARTTVSIPEDSTEFSLNFLTYVRSLSSREFRLMLGDPILEDLEAKAQSAEISFSNICLYLIGKNYEMLTPTQNGKGIQNKQLEFSFVSNPLEHQEHKDIGITFRESLHQGIHGWYPYVEGFSATYVRDTIMGGWGGSFPRTIYDPFAGAGTTLLAASALGIPSFYSEINPFMSFVTETKINAALWARSHFKIFNNTINEYLYLLTSNHIESINVDEDMEAFEKAFPNRDFFEEQYLHDLLVARKLAKNLTKDFKEIQSLLLLACASNAVRSSNMTRRADLRRRRSDEYKTRVVDVPKFVSASLKRILRDVEQLLSSHVETIKISDDCRKIPSTYSNSFDLAITSPPYLNGTNYFRNTKIELWLIDLISSEKELPTLCNKAIASGINNVSSLKGRYTQFEEVEEIACKLDICAKDKRIPSLVRHYFSDMQEVMLSVHSSLVPGGKFFIDIGDSKFYGIHVKTDKLLVEVAKSVGFEVEHEKVIAKRYSRDKTELVQSEILFVKPKAIMISVPQNYVGSLKENIIEFGKILPYKSPPYNSRSWGHNLHSLCSYQGKLKPSIAYWLIKEFIAEGSSILDPLGGVGTIAFEAALDGHFAVSNDKSPFAATIASAKLNPPSIDQAKIALKSLKIELDKVFLEEKDFELARFGLNASVADYYHPKTLEEILKARQFFLSKQRWNNAEMFIWASVLHILHGNRPYALSRTSHPITPLHPKGDSIYKSLLEKTYSKIERALKNPLNSTFRPGIGIHGDFRDLPQKCDVLFDAIITSPPFLGMRFDRPNWLRMWFCGWGESDFHKTSLSFLERQQTKSMDCYQDFFRICKLLLKRDGLLILHLGSCEKGTMVESLKNIASESYYLVHEVIENVQDVEQHGIRDKGYTKRHHLLFFKPIC